MSGTTLRMAIWLAGAIGFTCSYSIALAAAPISLPSDLPHDLLLAVSGLVACMVGGTGALLLFDRMQGKH